MTEPESHSPKRLTSRNNVLFPEPLRPNRSVSERAGASAVTAFRIALPPRRTVMFS